MRNSMRQARYSSPLRHENPNAYHVRLTIGMALTPYMAVDASTVGMEASDPPQRAEFRLESNVTIGEEGKHEQQAG